MIHMQVKMIRTQFHSAHSQANIFRISCQYCQQNICVESFCWGKPSIVHQMT